jgi:hypothetical protein
LATFFTVARSAGSTVEVMITVTASRDAHLQTLVAFQVAIAITTLTVMFAVFKQAFSSGLELRLELASTSVLVAS